MAAADKDLETLRKEHKELSDYAGRIAIVSLTILTLLTISYSRAWNRVQSSEVERALCLIKRAHEGYLACAKKNGIEDEASSCQEIQTSYVFGLRQEKYYEVDPCAAYSVQSAVATPTPTPTPTVTATPASTVTRTPCATPTPSPTPPRPPCSAECDEQSRLQDDLEKTTQSWFVVKTPIPGMDFTIDLRDWVYALPVIFCFFALYLYILRKKLALLEIAGTERLRQTKPEEVTQLDRLYFEGDRAYGSLPFNLTTLLVRLAFVGLPVYLVYIVCSVAWSYWDYGGSQTIRTVASIVVLFVSCAFAYAQFVSSRLERQMQDVVAGETAITGGFVGRSKQALKLLATSISPKVTLALGAALTLLSLIMPFTKVGFWSRRNYMGHREYLGHQLFSGSEARWPTFLGDAYGTYSTYARLGKGNYFLGLLVAVAALLLIIPTFSGSIRKWIIRASTVAAAMVVIVTLVDFSLSILDAVDSPLTLLEIVRLKTLVLITTLVVLLWAFLLIWRRGARRLRGLGILLIVLSIYAPAVVISALFIGWLDLEGLWAYLAGTLVLLLGFLHLPYRLRQTGSG